MVVTSEEVGGALDVASPDLGRGGTLDVASPRSRTGAQGLEMCGAVGVVSSEPRKGISSAVEEKVRAYECSC